MKYVYFIQNGPGVNLRDTAVFVFIFGSAGSNAMLVKLHGLHFTLPLHVAVHCLLDMID